MNEQEEHEGATEDWSPIDEVRAAVVESDDPGLWVVILGPLTRECRNVADVMETLAEWREEIQRRAATTGATTLTVVWYHGGDSMRWGDYHALHSG